jgi:hypothetical protein
VKTKTKIKALKVHFMTVKKNPIKMNIIPQDLIKIILRQLYNKIISPVFLPGKTKRMNGTILLVVEKQQNKN